MCFKLDSKDYDQSIQGYYSWYLLFDQFINALCALFVRMVFKSIALVYFFEGVVFNILECG